MTDDRAGAARATMRRRPRSLPALLERRRGPSWAPEPPLEPSAGRIVHIPGRGEFFRRDTGGDGQPVLLLHGWMSRPTSTGSRRTTRSPLPATACSRSTTAATARTPVHFRLADCADDAAAILRHEGIEGAPAVGYSMAGPIGCLVAHEYPELIAWLVLCATAPDWQAPYMKRGWRLMSLLRLELGLFPNAAWRAGLRALGLPDSAGTTWAAVELSRGSARDIAEAGRELGRYDGRAWLGRLRQPRAVIVPVEDTLVPTRKQRELAASVGVAPREVPGTHLAITTHAAPFIAALLDSLAEVGAPVTLERG